MALGQADSSILLQSVNVQSIRQSASKVGSKTQSIDSLIIARNPGANLGEILSRESPIFIKSYGYGALATTSFRGGSAAHTSVLWNGIPLNSPTNGQLDFSQIPGSFFNKASVNFGGGSTLWGSGAIGGSILLSRTSMFNKGFQAEANTQLGSFGQFGNQTSFGFGSKRYSGFVGSNLISAKNNFEVIDPVDGLSLGAHKNSQFNHQSLYTEHQLKLTKMQKVSLAYWHLQNERNIPPTLFEVHSNSKQEDLSHRVRVDYLLTTKSLAFEARAAYINESIYYSDEKSGLETNTDFTSIIAQVESKYLINERNRIIFGLSNSYHTAQGESFKKNTNQNQSAVFASHQYTSSNDRLKTNLSIRQEVLDHTFVPLVYSGGVDYNLTSWITLRAKASKDYRIPTLNDRFWSPGGNMNLKPESGFNEEIGARIHNNASIIATSFEATIFNRNIDNWILWMPNDGFWSPQNILKVWSRGMESRTNISFKNDDLIVDLNISTNYVVSTGEKKVNDEDQSIGLQMIYVPMYSGNAQALVCYRTISFPWNQVYTGYRYTASDHSQYLNPFWNSSAFVSWNPKTNGISITLYGRVNNIFNTSFQQIQNRPMPGRHYQLGLNLKLKSRKT